MTVSNTTPVTTGNTRPEQARRRCPSAPRSARSRRPPCSPKRTRSAPASGRAGKRPIEAPRERLDRGRHRFVDRRAQPGGRIVELVAPCRRSAAAPPGAPSAFAPCHQRPGVLRPPRALERDDPRADADGAVTTAATGSWRFRRTGIGLGVERHAHRAADRTTRRQPGVAGGIVGRPRRPARPRPGGGRRDRARGAPTRPGARGVPPRAPARARRSEPPRSTAITMNRSNASQSAGDWMREAVRSAITRLCAAASIQADVATGNGVARRSASAIAEEAGGAFHRARPDHARRAAAGHAPDRPPRTPARARAPRRRAAAPRRPAPATAP